MERGNITLETINGLNENTLVSNLGIRITDFGEDYIEGAMPVDDRTRQPMGFLHGGASLALAETVASIGSVAITDTEQYHIFGVQVTGNHVNTARSGEVIVKAVLINKGRSSHLWNCDITTPAGKLISTIRVTIAIVKKR